MLICFLDEFGHDGPYISKNHPTHNHSPVFGYGGFIIDVDNLREITQKFRSMSNGVYSSSPKIRSKCTKSGEVKGQYVFQKDSLKIKRIRQSGHRLMNNISSSGGNLYFYGMEKYSGTGGHKPANLHISSTREAVKGILKYSISQNKKVLIIMDQHSTHFQRVKPIIANSFRKNLNFQLVEPPHEADSELYDSVQAADWICSIMFRTFSYRAQPKEWSSDHAYFDTYNEKIVANAIPQSSLKLRQSDLGL